MEQTHAPQSPHTTYPEDGAFMVVAISRKWTRKVDRRRRCRFVRVVPRSRRSVNGDFEKSPRETEREKGAVAWSRCTAVKFAVGMRALRSLNMRRYSN